MSGTGGLLFATEPAGVQEGDTALISPNANMRRAWLLPLVLLAGCTEPNPAFAPAPTVCGEVPYFVGQAFTLAEPGSLDILFVVDNSEDMLAHQERLADAMGGFVERLQDTEVDWQLAVTSTDLSDQGAPLVGEADDCADNGPAVITSATGANAARTAAACNVVLGEEGWEIEQGLEAARRTILDEETFFRDDARRLIVFFGSEDDCSASNDLDRSDPTNCLRQPDALVGIADYAEYYRGPAHPRGGSPLSLVAIVPPASDEVPGPNDEIEPSCESAAPAFTGTRFREAVRVLAQTTPSFASSICASTYAPVLDRIVDEIVLQPSDQLCVSKPLVGSPREVLVSDTEDTSSATMLSEQGDYVGLAPADGCGNGGIAVAPDAHGGALGNRVEVRFCTDEDPAE